MSCFGSSGARSCSPRPSKALRSAELRSLSEDPDDLHVCALAIASGSTYLFTHDRGYLRERLNQHGIEVTEPDTFLTSALEDQPQAMLELLELQASTWAGGRPVTELLDALERADTSVFANTARHLLSE